MMRTPVSRWRSLTLSLAALVVSGGMLVRSADIAREHASLIGEVSRTALPIAAQVPALEERRALLTEQLDVARLASSARFGSLRERVHMFALPQKPVDRVIAALTVLIDGLRSRGELWESSSIEVQDVEGDDPLAPTKTFTVTLQVNEDGLQTLSRFLDLSGTLTVADVLSQEEISTLVRVTEEENPTGVVSLSQFLATDLSKYLRDPTPYDHRLLGEFASGTFASVFAETVQTQSLEDAGALMRGNIGRALLDQNLWPVPFLSIRSESVVELPDGWQEVTLTLGTHAS